MYLRKTVPVELPAGAYYNGACLTEDTEVNLDACSSATQCLLDPPLPPCIGEIEPTLTEQKLCDLVAGQTEILACLEILKNNPIAEIDGSLVDLKKCTLDGRPLVFYAATNEQTGEVTFTTYVLEAGELIPYEGTDCVQCNKIYNPINQYVADGIYCDLPVYECDGELYVFDTTTEPCDYRKIDKLATTFTPYVPGDAPKVYVDAQCSLFELLPADSGTVEDIVTAIIADKGLVFEIDGKAPVPVTVDDVMTFSIVRKACNTITSTGAVVESDWIAVNGQQLTNYTDDQDGGVDLAAAIEVPATGCALSTVCFEKCFTKAELALLA